MINEQYDILRNSFYDLDENSKNILDYFVIQRNENEKIDVNIDKYVQELKYKYLNNYNQN